MVGYALTILCSFVTRTVFIHMLSTEYLGVNGLFTNILNMLSLAELGIGSAIIYRLYKPILEKNEKKICELMNFYKKAYYVIALVVAGLGLILLPFLHYLIKEQPRIPDSLSVIYLLYLANSVISYLFIFKKSLIVGYQKEYLTSVITYGGTIALAAGQILVLLLTGNFLLYLAVQIAVTLATNVVNSMICDKLFPFQKNCRERLPKEEAKSIFKDLSALVIYKISGVVVTSTDNIIISKFIGLSSVGLFSNYTLIVNAVYALIKKGIESMTASIGNLNASGNVKEQERIYYAVNFMAFWIYGQIAVCLFVLINPFITLWLGKHYLLPLPVVVFIALNFYLQGITGIFAIFRNTFGLFTQGKYRPVFSAMVNLGASLFLVAKVGMAGVLMGTAISYISTFLWYDPYVVHKHVFQESTRKFYMRQAEYFLVVLAGAALSFLITNRIGIANPIANWVADAGITFFVMNALVLICFSRTPEFKRLLQNAGLLLRRKG